MEFQTMTQINKTKGAIVMAGLLGGLVLGGVPVIAQTSAPSVPTDQGSVMPKVQGGIMPGMMMNEEMQQKMSRMMDNCNRMMETMMQGKGGPSKPATPDPKG